MAGVTINVLDPEFYVDPWQAYRWLRDEAPVYWDPVQKLWVISRYDDILDAEKDTGRYSSSEGSRPLVDQREDMSMINMDDPRHQEQRRLVSRRFTPRAVRGHQDHVRGIVTGILDAVAPLGQCEAVEAIASRLPAIMISDLLGYPRELWERVRCWSEQTMVLSGQTSPAGPPHVLHPGIPPVMREFAETTAELIQARRAEPRDDLISVWASAPGWDVRHILEETILVLDDGTALDKAALVGCGVATGYGSAVRTAEVRAGETVVVMGIGGIGINAVQGARIAGARNIIAIDPVQFKRDKAMEFGATHTAATIMEAGMLVAELTRNQMADSFIITTDIAEAGYIGPALDMVAKRGKVVVTAVAHPDGEQMSGSLFMLTMMEKQIRGSLYGSSNAQHDIPRMLDLYNKGQLKLDELITREYALEDINQGYEDMRNGLNIRGLIRY